MRNTIWLLGLVFIVGLTLMGCSGGQQTTPSPNEIIANAVEKSDSYQTYYMESEMKIYENKKQTSFAVTEEWHDKEGHRSKSLSNSKNGDVTKLLSDAKQILIYTKMKGEETAYKATPKKMDENKLIQESQKEKMKNLLKQLKKDHEVKIVGEKDVAGRSTYHIKAIPVDENTFTGKQEIWIDQKTWLPLKMISSSGDIKVVLETKKIEFGPTFEKGTFTLDIPEDVKVKDLDKMNTAKTVEVEEATKALGQPFLKAVTKTYQLQKIELFQMESVEQENITLYYQKEHVPQFRISIMPIPKENKNDRSFLDKLETMTVRGDIKAKYMEKPIHSVFWDEDGLRYSISIDNPELKQDDIKQIINNMVLTGD